MTAACPTATSVKLLFFSLLALAAAVLAPVSASPSATGSEYALLRRIPADLFQALTSAGEPDAQGLVGAHRKENKWYEAGKQRSGCWYLIGAVVAGDAERADKAWASIEATFARQVEDGGFLSQQKPNRSNRPTREERVETCFFYLQELGHALLVIQQSPLAERFRDRIEALRPRVQRACGFINAGYSTIVGKVGKTTNRLLIAAKAFGLCGVFLGDEKLQDRTRSLVQIALKQRDEDGVFLEYGGRDSSYNSVSLLMGRVLWLHLPVAGLDEALVQAMAWQLTRIQPDGTVLVRDNTRTGLGQEKNFTGGIKRVNTREVALALCYHGLVHNDPAALELAAKVFSHDKD